MLGCLPALQAAPHARRCPRKRRGSPCLLMVFLSQQHHEKGCGCWEAASPTGRAADPRQGLAVWTAEHDPSTPFCSPGRLSARAEGRNAVQGMAGAPVGALTAGLG